MERLIMNNGDSSKLMHLFLQILSHLTGKRIRRLEVLKNECDEGHTVLDEKQKW
ncbi:hypothetical protein NDK25_20395 [Niallia taxi]|nr:hypothetical protein [Niallia taxi]MDE5054599.1 hypothetical protein [Niallia taxi]